MPLKFLNCRAGNEIILSLVPTLRHVLAALPWLLTYLTYLPTWPTYLPDLHTHLTYLTTWPTYLSIPPDLPTWPFYLTFLPYKKTFFTIQTLTRVVSQYLRCFFLLFAWCPVQRSWSRTSYQIFWLYLVQEILVQKSPKIFGKKIQKSPKIFGTRNKKHRKNCECCPMSLLIVR